MPEINELKTINGNSLIGSGNLSIGGGSFSGTLDDIPDGTNNKAYTSTEKTKLAGISSGATANDTDANLKNTDNHTDGTTNKVYSATDKTKLAGISAGAQVNSAITKAEIEAKLTGAITTHTHDYAATSHTHTGVYEPVKGSDDNYVTDSEKVVIGNTSGTNSGDETAAGIRTKLGTTTVGANINTLTNPSAITFLRVNADNTVTARTAAELRSDIGAQASGTYLTSSNIVSTITNGVTTNAPSEDTVFDALALKANLNNPTLVSPVIGDATGTSLAVTSGITSSGGGIGYRTGAGGTISQLTNRSTGVTLNKLCGNITMFSVAQAAQAIVTFTLTNSFIASTDFINVMHISATNGGAWNFSVVAGNGSCTITVRNVSTASITEATPLRFTIIKGVTA